MIDPVWIFPMFWLFGVGLTIWALATYKDQIGVRFWAIGLMILAVAGLCACMQLLFIVN